jgi:hypothetical protein
MEAISCALGVSGEWLCERGRGFYRAEGYGFVLYRVTLRNLDGRKKRKKLHDRIFFKIELAFFFFFFY